MMRLAKHYGMTHIATTKHMPLHMVNYTHWLMTQFTASSAGVALCLYTLFYKAAKALFAKGMTWLNLRPWEILTG